MNTIVKILIERDGISKKEAEELLYNARQEAKEYMAQGDTDAVEEILLNDLGLEIDYIPEFILE